MIKEYTSLGMMSGTSGDGVDASVIVSDGYDNYKVLDEKYYTYEENIFNNFHDLKNKINNINDLNKNSTQIKNLEKKITLFHAKIVKDFSQKYDLDIVGFHGQTIFHSPSDKKSIQIGDAKLLFQLVKKKIVYNFRLNDMLNGGEGAPLTPIFHKLLIKKLKINLPISVMNIGGIANLTLIKNFENKNILSKDIGPGNCLIDNWIRTNSNKKFDIDGKISSKGEVNKIILEQAIDLYENFNLKNDHKSFDVKDFDLSFIRGLSLEDGAATIIEYTAKILAASINDLQIKNDIKNLLIVFCGGGRKNNNLINRIRFYSNKEISFSFTDDYKIDGDFIESQAFGYLAIRSLLNLDISFTNTTGCLNFCTVGILIND